MQRRDFMTLIGCATAWPLAARAQQVTTPVVGFLHSGSKLRSPHVIGFGQGLNETGFVDGRNVTVQYRFAEGHYDRLPATVADFVNGNVAVLAAVGGVQTALAAKPASATIPVIFANGSDPVQFGLVESLNRPGANMTGVSFFTATLEAKRLGLLFELVPAARTFGILINPTNDNAELQLKDIAQGAHAEPTDHHPESQQRARDRGSVRDIRAATGKCAASGFRSILLRRTRKNRGAGGTLQFAGNVRVARICTSRRTRELRNQSFGQLSHGWRLRRTYPQRREAGKPASCAGYQVRICHQLKDCQDPQARSFADALCSRRRRDRVILHV